MKPPIFTVLSALLVLAAIVLHAQTTSGQQANRTTTPAPTTMPTTDADKLFAFDWIDTHSDAMNSLSLEIWNAAELSFREFKSSRALIRFLQSNGFTVEQRIGDMRLRRYTGRTSEFENFASMESLAWGGCGRPLFDQRLIRLGLAEVTLVRASSRPLDRTR